MTMTRQSGSVSSITPREISDTQSPNQVSASVVGATPQQIKALLLADGNWHDVQDCSLTQFVIGESQSPIAPSKLYTYLTYTESGRRVFTPIQQVVSFDIEMEGQSSSKSGGTSQQSRNS